MEVGDAASRTQSLPLPGVAVWDVGTWMSLTTCRGPQLQSKAGGSSRASGLLFWGTLVVWMLEEGSCVSFHGAAP